MVCGEKHVENPIPDNEWVCPSCGAGSESFYIDEVASDVDCELYHANDVVRCYKCNRDWTLKTIINKWAKKKNMVKCPCCNGTGWVQNKEIET